MICYNMYIIINTSYNILNEYIPRLQISVAAVVPTFFLRSYSVVCFFNFMDNYNISGLLINSVPLFSLSNSLISFNITDSPKSTIATLPSSLFIRIF